MYLTAGRNSRVILFGCLLSLAVLWSCRLPRLCLFDQCPQCFREEESTSITTSSGPVRRPADVDLSAPDAPFIPWPLARVCAEATTYQTPGIVFLCDNNSGGIGNIRNFILTCVRYAIDAGATGIVLPTIQTRSGEKLADLFVGKRQPFSYLFDEEHFIRALHEACPRITVYRQVEEVPGLRDDEYGRPQQPEMITPSHFGLRGGCDARDLDRHADLFGARFRSWLKDKREKLGLPGVSAEQPTLVRMNWGVQWTYPVWNDGPEFVATFGGLLRLRTDVLELSGRLVGILGGLVAAAREGEGGGEGGAPWFVGMHLRTENDALSAWPGFEEQSAAYLARTARLSSLSGNVTRFAYLATGNVTEAAKLAELAWESQRMRVLTKTEILAGEGKGDLLTKLNGLSWDQQALVDFVVLLAAECEYFLGVSPSSFSMNVALKRHLKKEGLHTRPWRVGGANGDGRSWLVGTYEGYWEHWLFMYESLWP